MKSVEYPVKLLRSQRKTIALRVDSTGSVVIKSPLFTPISEINRFIDSNAEWISNRVESTKRYNNMYPFTPGSRVPFKGDEILLDQIVMGNNVKAELEKWYRQEAKIEITKQVEYYSKLVGVDYNRISIRKQRTRWGSCSSKGNLNFNWKIILVKLELLTYLVIHELCHLKHMDHSKQFWNLVAQYDPDYKQHRKELQSYGYLLTNFLY